jgi:hypothetical protein
MFHIVRLTYVLRATGVISLSEEHTAYEWFTYDELIALESVDECIREVLDNVPPTFASNI